jgi:ribonucleoside-diphosphate reductase alpha chain
VIDAMDDLIRQNKISEKLIEKQKAKCINESNLNKVARAISMALRHNISILEIVKVLDTCHDGFSTVLFATKKILSKFIQDGTKAKGERCPDCDKSTIVYQEGCKMCSNCGWSACN